MAFALSCAGPGFAQTVDPKFWVTNGQVNALAQKGNTLYAGGTFTLVGPSTGSGVPLSIATGLLPASFPKVDGPVYAVAPDGTGGWYIGGQFTTVGGFSRSNIAHVASDMSVAAWNPNANGIGVRALAVNGTKVYAGGWFTAIGGQARNYIAALDTTTGLATAWNPNADSTVYALNVYNSAIYAGGAFTHIGGLARNRIAGLNSATGTATTWNPNANATVYAILRFSSTVYVAGAFTTVGGQARFDIAALDTLTGTATSWNPNANNSTVFALALGAGKIYAGGAFLTMGGQPRNNIAAISIASGLPLGWNPNSNSTVYSITESGGKVYAGGDFTTIGGAARGYIAALDSSSGLATAWNPNANNSIRALAVSGSTLYAGGTFSMMNAQTRNNLAAFDVTTGVATSWNPSVLGVVNAVAVNGSTVYVGGAFTTGGSGRNNVAAFDSAGAFTAWNPNANGTVNTIAVGNNKIYVGGSFTIIGGQSRGRCAALSVASGAALAWNPNCNGVIISLLVNGDRVYVGGSFSLIGGQSRNSIAVLDTSGGSAAVWNPNANANVVAMALSDSTLYVGGSFSIIGGSSRNRVAALNTGSGSATSWNPNATDDVYTLTLSGPVVYVGGKFPIIAGQPQRFLAALDRSTGSWIPWLDPRPDGRVFSVVVNGPTVYAGGAFTSLRGGPRNSLAAISAVPSMSSVQPDSGGNAGPLTVTIFGSGFASNFVPRLAQPGPGRFGTTITGTNTHVGADGMSITTTFDLTAAQPCTLGCTVSASADTMSASLPNVFTVTTVRAPELRVGLIGPDAVPTGARIAYDVVIENSGNVDALDVPLWISGVPSDATLEKGFALAYPPPSGTEPNWSTSNVPLYFQSPGGLYLPVVIPRIPPGTSVRRFFITDATPHVYKLRAAVTPPWADGGAFRRCLSNTIADTSCMGGQLTAINSYLAADSSVSNLSGIGVWSKIGWECANATTLPSAFAKAASVLGFMVGPVESPATALSACSDVLPPRWRDSLTVTIGGSFDPNDKLGTRDSVSLQQPIPYSIRFENDPLLATAPAKQVVIADRLNPSLVDPYSVSLGPITFGSYTIIPPPGLSSLPIRVDMPERNLIVNINVSLDPLTNTLYWFFNSTHPDGQPPSLFEGFLPLDVNPPEGEGSVLFTVMPRPTLIGGTRIENSATITFDNNAPRSTDPPWANIVDNTLITSRVLSLPAQSDQPSIAVSWRTDLQPPPADFRDFTIYVSEDGGPYGAWLQDTRATTGTWVPARDHRRHQYSFYSRARDLAGNTEGPPAVPDATTQSTTAVSEADAPVLALAGAWPNPARGAMRVHFTLPDRSPAVLELFDVAGRRLFRHDVGSLGPGSHSFALPAAPTVKPGLYFLRLAQGGRSLNARVAVIR